jgi:uncharacterized repeat protein (TIGR01451 family)
LYASAGFQYLTSIKTKAMRSFRLLLPVLFFILSVIPLQAQWVTIPQQFATYISTYVSAASISGSDLNTADPAITGLQNLTINGSAGADITGIQYFTGIQNLKVNTGIASLPPLPAGLQTLEINSLLLNTVSNIPSGLVALKINDAVITSLPSLPVSLKHLKLSSCGSLAAVAPLPAALQHLELSYCFSLTAFPALPATLTYFNARKTNYGPAISFPAGLDTIDISYCTNVTALTNLPAGLETLLAGNCNIASIAQLPDTMFWVVLSNNPLTSVKLPSVITYSLEMDNMPNLVNIQFTPGMQIGSTISVNKCPNANISTLISSVTNYYGQAININASGNNLTATPIFSTEILSLDLSYNPIQYLASQPVLNSPCNSNCITPLGNAYSVDLSHCQLTDINRFFFTDGLYSSVTHLSLAYNPLSNIYWLPAVSDHLYLNNCPITDIDPMVYLGAEYIDLKNTQLKCISWLYPSVERLYVANSPVNCLPNIPDTGFVCDMNYSVCQAGNSNNCPVLNTVGGIIFDDANQNTGLNNGEASLPKFLVRMAPDGAIHEADSTGRYRFQCQPGIAYTVYGMSFPYRTITTQPYSVTFPTLGAYDTINNIGVYTVPNMHDVYVIITPISYARPGFHTYYNVTVYNMGTTTQTPNVVLHFDPSLLFQTSSLPAVVSSNTLTWNISNLAPLQKVSSKLDFILPATVPLGTIITNSIEAIGNTPEQTPHDNIDTIRQTAIGSYDPNDKTAKQQSIAKEEIAKGRYIDYTVRFQNTGTASAINVRIEDTLSPLLDVNTIQMIDASHAYIWELRDHLLILHFNNINLPDSGANEALSHGFAVFRVKPGSNVAVGNMISNTAQIYFDFNPAIVTNTTGTEVNSIFIRQPKPQYLCEGEKLLLTAKVKKGYRIEWFKNNVSLGISTDTLLINNVTPGNAGFYQAIAYDDRDAAFAGVKAGIEVKAAVTGPLARLTMGTGMPYCSYVKNNIVSAAAIVPAQFRSYKWYRNGILIPGANTISLPLTVGQFFNNDTLAVIIRDSFTCSGWVSYAIDTVLRYNTPDTIDHAHILPQSVITCPAGTTLLQADIAAIPSNTTISWYRDNMLIGRGTSILLPNPVNNERIVLSTMSGNCAHIISSTGSTYGRDTAYIQFDSAAVISSVSIRSNTPLNTCNRVSFTTSTINEGANAHYQWLHNGALVGADSVSYTTAAFHQNDSISCIMYTEGCNTGNIDTVLSNTLKVDTAQLFPSVKIQLAGYVSSNSCKGPIWRASPTNSGDSATYQWYVNGTAIPGRTKSTDTLASLYIGDKVTCVMQPHLACSGTLAVSDSAIFTASSPITFSLSNINGDYSICPGTEVTFTTTLSNTSRLMWYKDGVFQQKGGNYKTGLTDIADFEVFAYDSGYYCWPGSSNIYTQRVLSASVKPEVYLTSSPFAGCTGGAKQFEVKTNPAGLKFDYALWTQDGVNMGGGNPKTFNPAPAPASVIAVKFALNSKLASCIQGPLITYDSIMVLPAENDPLVRIEQSPYLCAGAKTKTFSISNYNTGNLPDYTWFKNHVTAGANSRSYTDTALAEGDIIYCMVKSNNPCSSPIVYSDTLTLVSGDSFVTPSLNIGLIQNSACHGTALTFIPAGINAGGDPVYQWQVNGNNVASLSDTFTSSSLNNGDIVSCILTSSESCLTQPTASSNTILVSLKPHTSPSVSVMVDDAGICAGETVSFTATPSNAGNAPAYRWLVNGQPVHTGNSYSSNTLINGDMVTCEITSGDSCANPAVILSSATTVTVHPIPAKPVVIQNGKELTTTSAGSQWFLDGMAINGAVQNSYAPAITGWYNVQATVNGCSSSMSDSLYFVIEGISSIGNTSNPILIQPNPADRFLYIEMPDEGNYTFEITGKLGQLVDRKQSQRKCTIDTEHITNGLYFLSVRNSKGAFLSSHKIIVQH